MINKEHANKLKLYFQQNPDLIFKLLETVECHHIKYEQGGDMITCGLPYGDNVRSVQVDIETADLFSHIRTKEAT